MPGKVKKLRLSPFFFLRINDRRSSLFLINVFCSTFLSPNSRFFVQWTIYMFDMRFFLRFIPSFATSTTDTYIHTYIYIYVCI